PRVSTGGARDRRRGADSRRARRREPALPPARTGDAASAAPGRAGEGRLERFLEAAALRVGRERPPARNRPVAARRVESARLRRLVAGLEPQRRVAELAGGVLERREQRPPEALAAVGGDDVHPSQLADRLVEPPDAAAPGRLSVEVGDEKRAVRGLEVFRRRHRARPRAAVVTLRQLGLLGVRHRPRRLGAERLGLNLDPHAAKLHWVKRTYGGDQVSTWSVLRLSCRSRSPVGLVKQPGTNVSADNELALAA